MSTGLTAATKITYAYQYVSRVDLNGTFPLGAKGFADGCLHRLGHRTQSIGMGVSNAPQPIRYGLVFSVFGH